MLSVCEIFRSIQGESTHAGCICSFVRLSGCNLSCSFCDTGYAFLEKDPMTIEQIVQRVRMLGTDLVEITGGEPLCQKETPELCLKLQQEKYTVMIETNGSLPIDVLPEGCIRIVDVKCPGSGYAGSFLMKNLEMLEPLDELKFVVSDRQDFEWAVQFLKSNEQIDNTVIFSPVMNKIAPSDLAAWIIDANIPVRLGLQLHKIIWGDKRGV